MNCFAVHRKPRGGQCCQCFSVWIGRQSKRSQTALLAGDNGATASSCTGEITARAAAYIERLGFKFRWLDFLTGDGEPRFLEVYPNGQFRLTTRSGGPFIVPFSMLCSTHRRRSEATRPFAS
jgi:Tfp pilus assembly protein PilX